MISLQEHALAAKLYLPRKVVSFPFEVIFNNETHSYSRCDEPVN